ncbi:MAG: hypothetical protein Fur0023_02300 [Bacteroidia bacterium]
MKKSVIQKIISLITRAQNLASKIGIPNILQPGLVKEMIIAEILGHNLIPSKRDADACDKKDPSVKYEYLSCYEGGSGQLDRMFKEPKEKRKESLNRILRNKKIYFAVFYKDKPLKVKVIYEIEPKVLLKETEKRLDKSKNAISHISFSENWARQNGKVVFKSQD